MTISNLTASAPAAFHDAFVMGAQSNSLQPSLRDGDGRRRKRQKDDAFPTLINRQKNRLTERRLARCVHTLQKEEEDPPSYYFPLVGLVGKMFEAASDGKCTANHNIGRVLRVTFDWNHKIVVTMNYVPRI